MQLPEEIPARFSRYACASRVERTRPYKRCEETRTGVLGVLSICMAMGRTWEVGRDTAGV